LFIYVNPVIFIFNYKIQKGVLLHTKTYYDMKKIQLSTLIALLLFLSCKKNDNNLSVAPELQARVFKWIDEGQTNPSEKRKAYLDKLKENLEIENAWTSNGQEGEILLIIPINQRMVFVNGKNTNPRNYLVLFSNSGNQITGGGYIWQVPPGAAFTKNTIPNIYNHVEEDLNGAYVLLNMYDMHFGKFCYKNGKLSETGEYTRRRSASSQSAGTGIASSVVCTDWYLITHVYDAGGGLISSNEQYLGRTCGCGNPNEVQVFDCDESEGGGGSGGGVDVGEIKQQTYTWVPYERFYPAHRKLTSMDKLEGIVYPFSSGRPPEDSRFTNNTHISHSFQSNPWQMLDANGNTITVPYATLESGASSNTYIPHAATAHFLGTAKTCYGQPEPINQPKTWVMFVDF
jgi:hypothetical protein